ncbi:hypothetical protein SPRG_13616 [Saprolegnia parasitica CBS 223.65]|uniref:Uncharacterized protein n=1 Tax=Saprolegnia parasitica (strain CBS 223.65) TaxID=695850 RepID=A0A067BVD8_SAPPC|nr:hypothetical protein SPRG_13616 [Saprolegnia parasitica CBS 223.65]KDO20800.1 hypothetical protein SPRG_13616 [Saprolegnia parasitica CBS 223.65]|eukprot:XP_012208459.1 hypothetical protein SPRG_13616 [Saprolegnia parasitica CBS 223.65]
MAPTSKLRAWWQRTLASVGPRKQPPTKRALSKARYICTCVALNALAHRRGAAPIRYDAPTTPITLPREFTAEAKDVSVVGGKRVPFCPIQTARMKRRRAMTTFAAIDEDATTSCGQLVCPGCAARARLSASVTHCAEPDDDDSDEEY